MFLRFLLLGPLGWVPELRHTRFGQQGFSPPDPWADPKSRSTSGFLNLHHRSIGVQNWGIYNLSYHTIPEHIILCHTILYYTTLIGEYTVGILPGVWAYEERSPSQRNLGAGTPSLPGGPKYPISEVSDSKRP